MGSVADPSRELEDLLPGALVIARNERGESPVWELASAHVLREPASERATSIYSPLIRHAEDS